MRRQDRQRDNPITTSTPQLPMLPLQSSGDGHHKRPARLGYRVGKEDAP